MQLLLLLSLLAGPYLLLTLLDHAGAFKTTAPARAKAGLSLFFAFTAVGHLVRTEEMSAMLPAAFPYRLQTVRLTGILELLGAIGIWLRYLKRLTGICLIAMLVVFLPANIYSAMHHVDFGGHGSGPIYLLVRVPFQLLVIAWTYWATEQRWFIKTRSQTH